MSDRSAPLVIRDLSKSFDGLVALRDVDLELPPGRLICFLGPSGCGKTTLLRILAGLEMPSAGRVVLGDAELTAVPAHRRNVGMVFQSYALFPHLNVAENVAYGLRIRGVGRRERQRRADELLSLVKLPGVGRRHPAQLSGGQRQRVAMARALALDPDLFLLDEPLSALDAKLRLDMQVELKRLQRRLGITTIIVTHDQDEAMTMADLVVVMGDNRVQQVGPPLEVYRRPVNRFVADFIGINNFLPARVTRDGEVEVMGRTLAHATPEGVSGEATLSIRPEDVRLHARRPDAPAFEGRVSFVRDVGRLVETLVRVGEQEVAVIGAPPLDEGTEVWLELPPDAGTVLTS
jgi:putative spermidine/putrescine transport system ATP-binding protein